MNQIFVGFKPLPTSASLEHGIDVSTHDILFRFQRDVREIGMFLPITTPCLPEYLELRAAGTVERINSVPATGDAMDFLRRASGHAPFSETELTSLCTIKLPPGCLHAFSIRLPPYGSYMIERNAARPAFQGAGECLEAAWITPYAANPYVSPDFTTTNLHDLGAVTW